MYQKLIEKINPKPKFNLTWYKNEDLYSEGDIEDLIIKLIAENKPEDYVDAIYENFNWSTYYHLTHVRKNILNWYPFDKNADVLEIGCGLGAITSVLCDGCKSVTAVELSKKRATAALLRCREKDNLEIIVGNLNDIEFEKKFDYITLIGVLEYQGCYTATENPYVDFLKKIKKLLKPNGKLLVAIENQYGLKYWCGAREDHTGLPFDGMNQYTLTSNKARTFSKKRLESIIKESGFKNTYFYYPMPDYKLPTVVYSQDCLPKNENMQNMFCYYVPDRNSLIIQEENVYKDIIANGVFEFFANSFLVECSDSEQLGEVTFASMSVQRLPEYRIATRFRRNQTVEKFMSSKNVVAEHLTTILKNEKELEQRGMALWKSELIEDKLVAPFSQEELWEDNLLRKYKEKNIEEIYKNYEKLYDEILKSSDQVDYTENILYKMNLSTEYDEMRYGMILKVGYIDMIFRNAFIKGDTVWWFDQEWTLVNVPAQFVLYRAIKEFYYSYKECENILPKDKVYEYFNMFAVEEYEKLETLFADSVIDVKHFTESNYFAGGDRRACLINIQKIIGDK